MNVFYFHAPNGNFGDDLNAWLWAELFGDAVTRDDGLVLAGVGTILNEDLYAAHPHAAGYLCLGAGAGYRRTLRDISGPAWRHATVRGPLSARVLGLDPNSAGTDGAILLATLPRYRHGEERTGEVLFVPHHDAAGWPGWPGVCAEAGVTFLSPECDSRVVLDRLRRARLVLADSMHAAICADVFRTPWLPVVTSPRINSFKWLDWTQSMGLPYEPARLPAGAPSAALDARMARLLGERHGASRSEPEAIMRQYISGQRRPHGPEPGFWQRQAGRFDRHVVAALGAGLDRVPMLERRSRAALVAALAGLARAPGLLSDDARFADRRDLMLERRDVVARIVAATPVLPQRR